LKNHFRGAIIRPSATGHIHQANFREVNMNKKIALGCTGGVVIAIVVFVVFVLGILYFIFGSLKSNPAYQMGMEMIRNDPAAVEIFGSPIQDGFFVGGKTESNLYGASSASLSVAISGPKTKGSAQIFGTKPEGGEWQVKSISIRVNGQKALIYNQGLDTGLRLWK
jgi:hypothetical protein